MPLGILRGAPVMGILVVRYQPWRLWESSRVKMVGLDALPTYKRVAGWFPGPVEDMECYLQQLHRLNWGTEDLPLENLWAQGGTQWCPPCVQYWFSNCCGTGKDGMPTLQQHGTSALFPSCCKTRRREVGMQPNMLLWAPIHLLRPTWNTVSLLLEFLLEQ